jgi:hypothetical protein
MTAGHRRGLVLLGAAAALGVVAACATFDESGAAGDTAMDAGILDASVPDGSSVPEAAADDASKAREWLYVFVSSQAHVGKFPPPDGGSAVDGIAGAASFCKRLADASKFDELHSRQWAAFLSTANAPAWRQLPVSQGAPALTMAYRLRDGVTEVFPKGFVFEPIESDGGTINPRPTTRIVLDEQADGARSLLSVWTGTAGHMMTHVENCRDWNSALEDGDPHGLLGTTSVLTDWAHSSTLGAEACSKSHHVYCFELP